MARLVQPLGADEIFVKPDFVHAKDYLKKTEKVSLAVLGVNGTFRRAIVDLVSPFVKGKVKCIVIPDLGPDILIGEKTIFENGKKIKLPVFPNKRLLKNLKTNESDCTKSTKKKKRKRHIKPRKKSKMPTDETTTEKCKKSGDDESKHVKKGSIKSAKFSTKKIDKNVMCVQIAKDINLNSCTAKFANSFSDSNGVQRKKGPDLSFDEWCAKRMRTYSSKLSSRWFYPAWLD